MHYFSNFFTQNKFEKQCILLAFIKRLNPVLVSNDSLPIAINVLYILHVQRVFFVSLSMAAITKTLLPLKDDSARNL